MTNKKRLIIVSNRLPFQVNSKKEGVSFQPSSGGLVSSLRSYIEHIGSANNAGEEIDPLWIGSLEMDENRFINHFKANNTHFDGFGLHPVFISEDMYDLHYNGFCNDLLWPLFHYFPSYAKFNDDYFHAYQNVNNLFAQKVAEVYRPGDIIWIHDYHLMLLPALLRQLVPNASIGFFLHIPFPSFEIFRLLPNKWRVDILNGLMGADLVGFHTNDYVQYFLKSVQRLLGFDNVLRIVMTQDRSVMTDTFPVGIDFEKFHSAALSDEVLKERDHMKESMGETKLIVSVDRLDYTKGLINRLESFEVFLQNHPAYRGKVTYFLLVIPSRDIITQYKEIKKKIEETIGRINGRFGTIQWTPVIYQYRSVSFEKLAGIYLAGDLALITPLRDGMNLVAKEYVATQYDKQSVLILSETAGVAAELSEALLVNPTDRKEVGDAIAEALEMPVTEQIRRNAAMQKRIRDYNVVKWADDFISSLGEIKKKQESLHIKEVSLQAEQRIVDEYSSAAKRLIILDYDGTLTPFTKLPEQAEPGPEIINLLYEISSEPKNTVVLISGRPVKTLDDWFGKLPLNLVAEHGAFMKEHRSKWKQTMGAETTWKEHLMPILQKFAGRCAGSFVEEKNMSLAWHYRNSNNELGFLRSRELINELQELTTHFNIHLIDGNKVVEVRTRGINKGTAVKYWLDKDAFDFCLAIGDDKTDEDMFKAMPEENYSIRVGLMPSAARFNLKTPKEVMKFLQKLHVGTYHKTLQN